MNDDFEKQLQRQPLRQLPPEWREEVLYAAAAPLTIHHSPFTVRAPWWRELFWPNPAAWASLAAVWVAIFALNLASSENSSASAAAAPATSPEVMQALNQQRLLFAELIRSTDLPPTEPPKPFLPRPRSETRPTTVAV